MDSVIGFILIPICVYYSARLMKESGKSWALGAILGLFFNIFGLIAVYFIKNRGTRQPRIGKNQNFAIEQFNKLVSYTNKSINDFSILLESMNNVPPNRILLTINDVILREVRSGTVVSKTSGEMKGQSRGGAIGVSGKHIGIAATSSTFRGKMHSTSITPPAPESLHKIDEGKLVIKPDVIAFVGTKYSKSIEYKDILDWVSNPTLYPFTSQLTIAVRGADKVVVFVLSSPSEGEFLEIILSEVVSSKNQVLDTSLRKGFQSLSSEYMAIKHQEVRSIENLVENKVNVEEEWKSFVLNKGKS
jgi:hypothetical protein